MERGGAGRRWFVKADGGLRERGCVQPDNCSAAPARERDCLCGRVRRRCLDVVWVGGSWDHNGLFPWHPECPVCGRDSRNPRRARHSPSCKQGARQTRGRKRRRCLTLARVCDSLVGILGFSTRALSSNTAAGTPVEQPFPRLSRVTRLCTALSRSQKTQTPLVHWYINFPLLSIPFLPGTKDSLSSDAQTPFAYSTAGIPKAMSPQGDSALVLPSNASSSLASSYSITSVTGGSGGSMAGKKRKPPTFNSSATAAAPDDVDVDRALLYRKTDDGSVKIAITQNGKMKVKIADSALAATSSSVPSAVAAMGSVSTPQSLSASSGATGTGIVPLNALASAAAVNKAFGTPPVAPIFSKVSSKLGGAGGVGAAGMGAGGAGSSGTPVASWPTGLAAGPAGGVPKQQKSKAAKNLSALEKNKSRNRKKGGGGGGASAAQQQDGEDTPLNEADLAILRGDYSNAKAPANQIPINQFFSFVDTQFFRSLCDEDFAFLDHTGDEVTPYVLPRLGRNYHEQWAEEDNNLAPLKAQQQPFWTPEFGYQQPPPPPPAGPREYEEADDTVYGGDVYIGPLAERILASLAEGGGGGGAVGTLLPGSGEEDTAAGAPAVVPGALSRVRTTADVLGFEERLRSELRHLGLFGDGEVETDPTEQDEICAELRMLQNELRQQVAENAKRKAVLKEIASFYRGYEQYNSVLDAISKQIESDYLKRYRQNPNKKKKSGGSRPSGGGSSSTAGGSAASLSPALGVGTAGFAARHNISDQTLDNIKKRRMLIDSIGSLFPYDRVTFPSESIYAGLGVAGEVGAETAGTPSAMDL
ncbi:histone acetyltransferases subunit 3-domain-containing protein [Chytriomyces sp. MP71]|nr:histone acetyltransferases subunit 3-domain-containing protein [Chytriomyces sp. MP71]